MTFLLKNQKYLQIQSTRVAMIMQKREIRKKLLLAKGRTARRSCWVMLSQSTTSYAFFALKSLAVSNNNWTSSSVQTRCVSSVLIFFFEAYLTLHLALYFRVLHIKLNMFPLIIFKSKRLWLHFMNLILYHKSFYIIIHMNPQKLTYPQKFTRART